MDSNRIIAILSINHLHLNFFYIFYLYQNKLIEMSKLMVLFLGAHNNIKTWLCLSDIKWLRCRFVNLLPYKETQNCFFFFSFLFFCFLQKRESCVLPCSISNNETKFIWSWGDISSVIMIIFAWGSTLMLPMSGKSIAGSSVIFDCVEK